MSGYQGDGADPYLTERLDRLRRLRDVPDEVLIGAVVERGLSWELFDTEAGPYGGEDGEPGVADAAAACAGCPVSDACLELDLRTSGPNPSGVAGGLSPADRRELHRLWTADRGQRPPDPTAWRDHIEKGYRP